MVMATLVMMGLFLLVQVVVLIVVLVKKIVVFSGSSLQPALNTGGMDVQRTEGCN